MGIIFENFLCFLFGHKPYRYKWQNKYYIRWNRKGGKKKKKGKVIKHDHYREYCERCGKLLKKG